MSTLADLASDNESSKNLLNHAIVINGHGAKTNTTFEITNNILLTPEDLSKPYVLSVNPSYSIEQDFQQGKVKPVNGGHWQLYDESINHTVPNVKIGPWQYNEATSFAKRIISDKNLFSSSKSNKDYYMDRDPNAALVVKQGDAYKHLTGDDAMDAFHKLANNQYSNSIDGVPLFFYAPEAGKIKVLGNTDLAEILDQLYELDGDHLVMLATCNASYSNQNVTYNCSSNNTVKVTDLAQIAIDNADLMDCSRDNVENIEISDIIDTNHDEQLFANDSQVEITDLHSSFVQLNSIEQNFNYLTSSLPMDIY